MLITRLLCRLALVLLSASAVAAPQRGAVPPDSLRRLLATLPPDTNRLTLLGALCAALPAPVEAQPYAAEGLRLAQRLGHRRWQMQFRSVLMQAAHQQEDYGRMLRHAQQLLRQATTPPVAPLYAARASSILGLLAENDAEYQTARSYYRQSLRWATAAPPSPQRLRALAYGYTTLSGGYLNELDERNRPVDSLIRAAQRANRFMIQVARQLRAIGDTTAYQGFLTNGWDALSSLATQLHQPDSAVYYCRLAIKGYQRIGDERLALTRRQQLAKLYLSSGQFAQTVALARATQPAAQRLQMPLTEVDILETLARALDTLGRGHEAYQAQRRAAAIQDTMRTAEKRAEIARLRVSFETERKEARIRELARKSEREQAEIRRQRLFSWGLAGALFFAVTALATSLLLSRRLRRSRTQLAATNASKDRLYAVIAHDLRGPIQSLEGVAGMIAHLLDRQQFDALRQLPPLVGNSVRTVNQLLDNLLHWAASQTGELTFNPTALPAQLLLDESAALWGSTALANQVELRLLPAPAGATVWGDPQMVRTVLRNLVGNALKFTPSGKSVSLSVEVTPTGTNLVVTDAGPGLTAAAAAALLRGPDDRGTRRTGAHGETGTGLGLQLCRLLLGRHGGELQFEGQPGVGTTVRAFFPMPA